MSPWSPKDAPRFSEKTAKSDELQRVWSEAANSALKQYRDEGRAIRVANSAVTKATQKQS